MSQPIIEVRGLSKRYRLGAIGATSLREEFSRRWDRLRGVPHPNVKEFWALRDVSFDVQPGEIIGIIGRNGAGKSTLLKILSRITEPTAGSAVLRGRVASLLEVGTGFHPELTGRENVFLNGAILGMTRAEIRAKFDEIVAFAEVEKFIDTPVKHYSSGMYVRLAFAVAAHLEPEILIVDEVLAVGDYAFQQKCLGKMSQVARDCGRTILYVSHQLTSLAQLCPRCLMLAAGSVVADASAADVIGRYLSVDRDLPEQVPLARLPRNGAFRQHARLVEARSILAGLPPWQFAFEDPIRFWIGVECSHSFARLDVAAMLVNSLGVEVLSTVSHWAESPGPFPPGRSEIEITLPALALAPGSYVIHLGLRGDRETEDFLGSAIRLTITEAASRQRREVERFSGCLLPIARFVRRTAP